MFTQMVAIWRYSVNSLFLAVVSSWGQNARAFVPTLHIQVQLGEILGSRMLSAKHRCCLFVRKWIRKSSWPDIIYQILGNDRLKLSTISFTQVRFK